MNEQSELEDEKEETDGKEILESEIKEETVESEKEEETIEIEKEEETIEIEKEEDILEDDKEKKVLEGEIKEEILEIDEVVIRNYPKAIFFSPLFLCSLIFWIIQAFLPDLNSWLGSIWVIVFFSNLTVTALDFPSYRVLILILGAVIIILLLIFLGLVPTLEELGTIGENINIGLTAEFYMIMMIVIGLILGLVILNSRFNYYRIERNEIIHKKGIFSTNVERYPVRGIRIKQSVPDLFEYLMFRAGSLTLIFAKGDIVHLNTVINVKKKAEQIDYLLSSLHVIVE